MLLNFRVMDMIQASLKNGDGFAGYRNVEAYTSGWLVMIVVINGENAGIGAAAAASYGRNKRAPAARSQNSPTENRKLTENF